MTEQRFRLPPRTTQALVQILLYLACGVAIFILAFVIIFILKNGLPVVTWRFLTGPVVDMGKAGGIFPSIVGTVFITGLALCIATPLGVGSAIYLTEYTRPTRITRFIRFGVECLAGVPSIIFGLFGFVFFVVTLRLGWSILSGGLSLAAMLLPTIIRTSEEAIKAVPVSYREVSYCLGTTRWQTVVHSVLPSALPGILTGIILSIGRSVGETAVLIFTAGSAIQTPTSLMQSARTMSVHFYLLAREGISMQMAYGTAAILVISILIINIISYGLMHRFISRRTR